VRLQPLTTVSPVVVHVYDNVPVPPVAVTEYVYVCPTSMATGVANPEVIVGAELTVTMSQVEDAEVESLSVTT
jgi:hypothetical protein